MVAAGTLPAQDIRVNVTGSNIKKVDTETAAPLQVITREDIDASGLQTISDVVRQITANNNGTIDNSWSGIGFPTGASGVSLRGLGTNNTLVLLNGRRLAVYGLADDGQVFVRRPEPDPVRRGRAHRDPEAGRVGDLRIRRGGGRGQHHHCGSSSRAG